MHQKLQQQRMFGLLVFSVFDHMENMDCRRWWQWSIVALVLFHSFLRNHADGDRDQEPRDARLIRRLGKNGAFSGEMHLLMLIAADAAAADDDDASFVDRL